jgi:hypothetical protein
MLRGKQKILRYAQNDRWELLLYFSSNYFFLNTHFFWMK